MTEVGFGFDGLEMSSTDRLSSSSYVDPPRFSPQLPCYAGDHVERDRIGAALHLFDGSHRVVIGNRMFTNVLFGGFDVNVKRSLNLRFSTS